MCFLDRSRVPWFITIKLSYGSKETVRELRSVLPRQNCEVLRRFFRFFFQLREAVSSSSSARFLKNSLLWKDGRLVQLCRVVWSIVCYAPRTSWQSCYHRYDIVTVRMLSSLTLIAPLNDIHFLLMQTIDQTTRQSWVSAFQSIKTNKNRTSDPEDTASRCWEKNEKSVVTLRSIDRTKFANRLSTTKL